MSRLKLILKNVLISSVIACQFIQLLPCSIVHASESGRVEVQTSEKTGVTVTTYYSETKEQTIMYDPNNYVGSTGYEFLKTLVREEYSHLGYQIVFIVGDDEEQEEILKNFSDDVKDVMILTLNVDDKDCGLIVHGIASKKITAETVSAIEAKGETMLGVSPYRACKEMTKLALSELNNAINEVKKEEQVQNQEEAVVDTETQEEQEKPKKEIVSYGVVDGLLYKDVVEQEGEKQLNLVIEDNAEVLTMISESKLKNAFEHAHGYKNYNLHFVTSLDKSYIEQYVNAILGNNIKNNIIIGIEIIDEYNHVITINNSENIVLSENSITILTQNGMSMLQGLSYEDAFATIGDGILQTLERQEQEENAPKQKFNLAFFFKNIDFEIIFWNLITHGPAVIFITLAYTILEVRSIKKTLNSRKLESVEFNAAPYVVKRTYKVLEAMESSNSRL